MRDAESATRQIAVAETHPTIWTPSTAPNAHGVNTDLSLNGTWTRRQLGLGSSPRGAAEEFTRPRHVYQVKASHVLMIFQPTATLKLILASARAWPDLPGGRPGGSTPCRPRRAAAFEYETAAGRTLGVTHRRPCSDQTRSQRQPGHMLREHEGGSRPARADEPADRQQRNRRHRRPGRRCNRRPGIARSHECREGATESGTLTARLQTLDAGLGPLRWSDLRGEGSGARPLLPRAVRHGLRRHSLADRAEEGSWRRSSGPRARREACVP